MPTFSTLGESKTTVLERKDDHGINIALIGKKLYVPGDLVQVDSDGEFDNVSDGTLALGVVHTGNKNIDTDVVQESKKLVTVITRGIAEANVIADGAITAGQPVKYDAAISQTDGVPTYSVAAATEVAQAIALTSAIDNAAVKVLVLMAPYTVA